jgi:predicted RNase H-like HicB family nuclease
LEEKMVKKFYKVIFEPQEEGGYTVTVPSLPGCISEGDTYDKALANIQEAIALYLESLKADGLPVPEENHLIVEIEAPDEQITGAKKP